MTQKQFFLEKFFLRIDTLNKLDTLVSLCDSYENFLSKIRYSISLGGRSARAREKDEKKSEMRAAEDAEDADWRDRFSRFVREAVPSSSSTYEASATALRTLVSNPHRLGLHFADIQNNPSKFSNRTDCWRKERQN